MMETMSLNPEQFYKPEKKDDKPQLKLNLNLGMEDRWNTVLSSPDLKKIAINTPELDRMVANTQVFGNYNSQLPPPYSAHGRDETVSVQGPSMTQMPGPEEEEVTRSFIAALREIHEQNDFKSETFNLPASSAAPTIQVPYTESYKPQIAAPECSQSWNNFQPPVSSYGYNPMQTSHHNYMASQPSYMQQEQLPQYEDKSLIDTFIPDPNQIDKLNLSTAEKLNIYSQIPIHEVADPELQERLKSERKKMRNRIAASKCRKRKLQKEAELEDKVKILKKKNTDLSSQLLGLRDEVKELKVKIMSHVNAGCAIKSYTQHGQDQHGVEQTLNSMQPVTPMQLVAPVVSLPSMHMNTMTL